MIGRTLSHYKILEKLGEGGMGEVYLAEDTELGRRVALKVLRGQLDADDDLLARFRREARAVAALNHPNIVTIHSVEEAIVEGDDDGEPIHFLTMELVDGVGLDHKIPQGGLSSERIFELAIPLADALSAAHKAGIAHRDLKPANVMLTSDGRVKILDFGLAKLTGDEVGEHDTTQALTQPGLVMGTVPYMSPEQLSGEAVDHRTDIFALGVILYEMATGRRPFAGESSGLLISAILRDDPPSVTEIRQELPFHLGRIVRRCLEKDPNRRYQAAVEVRNELEALQQEVRAGLVTEITETVPAATPVRRGAVPKLIAAVVGAALLAGVAAVYYLGGRETPSGDSSAQTDAASDRTVVVLEFENLGPPGDEYFAAGITEEITSRLATVGGMRVISRNSALRYAGTDKTLQQIGEELAVDHVLGGSVRWAQSGGENRVRITPRLTRVSDNTQIWSESYDKVFADVFDVQSEIADSVTRELGVTLLTRSAGGDEARPTQSPEAYQAYLRGLDHNRGTTLDERQLAIDMYVRATELDPDFAHAWARLAWTYAHRHFNGDFRDDFAAKAEQAVNRALELAPDEPLVQLAEGFYHYYVHRDFDRALTIFNRVVEQSPNDVDAISAVAYIYRRQGRLEESIAELERASALDPQNPDFVTAIAETYSALRRSEEAIATIDRALAMAPDRWILYVMKANLLTTATGETAAARGVLSQSPEGPGLRQSWIALDWLDRDFDTALARLDAWQPTNPFEELNLPIQKGLTYFLMGDVDRARPHLEESIAALETLLAANSQDARILRGQAVLNAALGNREPALEEIERAIELRASDRYAGPAEVEAKALVLALLGESDAAVDLLEELLDQSYENATTRAMLRELPFWDPLRSNPRFEELIAG